MRLTDHVYLVGSRVFGISHELDCSVYVVDCGAALAMVDAGAGCAGERILDNMRKDGLNPHRLTHIFLTHSHSDHAGGANQFRQTLGCEVCIGKEEADIVERGDDKALGLELAKEIGFYPPDYRFRHCEVSVRMSHGDTARCGGLAVQALHTPGHTKGSYCFLAQLSEGRVLFSGDTVFADGKIFLSNVDYSDLADYRRHLSRLSGLAVQMLMPGHGVFRVSGGQKDIDAAVANLKKIRVPPNFV